MKRPIFVVEYLGTDELNCTDLTRALRFIGYKISGHTFGCMNVTAAAAMQAGYSIRQR